MANQPNLIQAYGVAQALNNLTPRPIVAKRAPQASDTGYILGQLWIYSTAQIAYILVQVAGGAAVWQVIEEGGGVGVFSSLTVNPGPVALVSTGNGSVTIGNSSNTAAVTITAGVGGLSIIGAGHTIAIGSDAAANTVTLGSTTGASTTTLNGGTGGLRVTAPFLALPGPVYIYTGAGAPAGGLALHTGDLYINTSAASTTTRLYIATGAGTWTFFTANA